PLRLTASTLAATPNCENRSIREYSFRPIVSLGLKSLTSAATETPVFDASKLSIGEIPEFPAFILSQQDNTSLPIGEIVPIPVITTLCILSSLILFRWFFTCLNHH